MLTHCSKCGHELWHSIHAIGEFNVLLFLDNQEGSSTYGKVLRNCPTCSSGLPIVDAQGKLTEAAFLEARRRKET